MTDVTGVNTSLQQLQQQLEQLEQELYLSEQRLSRVQRIARIGSWEWDFLTKELYFSPELFSMLGFEGPDLPHVSLEWFYRRINPADALGVKNAFVLVKDTGRSFELTFRVKTRDGSEIVVASQAEFESDANGTTVLLAGTLLDVTDRTRAEREIHHLAYYDSLTGLANRTLLHDRLQQAIILANRNNTKVGVLMLDLDRFKGVNESLGYSAGDELLQIVAQRLQGNMRKSDTLARIGGDEFVVVLGGLSVDEGVSSAADKLLSIISRPFHIYEQELFLTASIGVAVYPADGNDAQTLLKHADLAMYQAKDMDRNNFQYFSTDLNIRVMERVMLESSLRRSLERNELQLLYQPQVDATLGKVIGFEALLRWYHPVLGMIAPDKFIPLAEETGLIHPIGEWVIRTACKQNKVWQDAGLSLVKVAVNLSGKQFKTKLDQLVSEILSETGLAASWLELELTESTLMHNAAANQELLLALSGMGCSLSIDDFGTGYSSLAYLKNFPLGRLKIDRSFVRDITTNPDDMAIAKIIIDMAQTLKMDVTAEGVEDRQQMELLQGIGCCEMQGYLFSKPVTADAAGAILRNGIRF